MRGTAYAGGLSKEVQTRPAETPYPETSSQEDVNIGDAGEEEEQIAQHETSPTNLIAPRGHAHTMHPSASYNALVGQGYGVPAYSVQNPRKSVRRIAQPPQDFQVTVQDSRFDNSAAVLAPSYGVPSLAPHVLPTQLKAPVQPLSPRSEVTTAGSASPGSRGSPSGSDSGMPASFSPWNATLAPSPRPRMGGPVRITYKYVPGPIYGAPMVVEAA